MADAICIVGGDCPACDGYVEAPCDGTTTCTACGALVQHEADYDVQGDPPTTIRSDHWSVIAPPDACPTCGHAPTKHAGFHLTETCRCPRTEEAKP